MPSYTKNNRMKTLPNKQMYKHYPNYTQLETSQPCVAETFNISSLKRVSSLFALFVLIIGIPITLYALGGFKLPTTLPPIASILHTLLQPAQTGFWITSLTLLAWISWLYLFICISSETFYIVKNHQPSSRGRGIGRYFAAQLLIPCLSLLIALHPGSVDKTSVTAINTHSSAIAQEYASAIHTPSANPITSTPELSKSIIGKTVMGITAVGIVNIIERRRRAQRRHREIGNIINLPQGHSAIVESSLRRTADFNKAHLVELGMKSLAMSIRSQHLPPPLIEGVRIWDHELKVLLSDSQQIASDHIPPMPWTKGENNQWSLDNDAIRYSPPPTAISPMPCLTTLGQDNHGIVMIDLEQIGSLALTGNMEVANSVMLSICCELATSAWGESLEILLIGLDSTFCAFERVRFVQNIDKEISWLKSISEQSVTWRSEISSISNSSSSMLQPPTIEKHLLSMSQCRLLSDNSGWEPIVVVCSDTVPQYVTEEIAKLAIGGSGICMVNLGALPTANTTLEIQQNYIQIPPFNATVIPQKISSFDYKYLGELLEATSCDKPSVPTHLIPASHPLYETTASIPPISANPTVPASITAVTSDLGVLPTVSTMSPVIPTKAPTSTIEITVLGNVEIKGDLQIHKPPRGKSKELIIYLAMRNRPTKRDIWVDALWPNSLPAQRSIDNTASEARTWLGSATMEKETQAQRLLKGKGGLYLDASVTCDWHKFQQLAEYSDPAKWEEALTLITGRPFEGMERADWVVRQGFLANIEAKVVDLADRLSEHFLNSKNASKAMWAARQGLSICPWDERLYRMLMRAEYCAGNKAGVRAVMRELIQMLDAEVEPYDTIHPETKELYEQLMSREE